MTIFVHWSVHLVKKISFVVIIAGYLLAGINHFVHPAFYVSIIPKYIPWPKLMNILAGCFEILFALMLIFPKTRFVAAAGIVIMLAAFMPVHIQMIIDTPPVLGNFHVSVLGAWIRVLFQPVLMLWAWWHRK